VQFSVELILGRKLGTQDQSWPRAEEWLKRCESSEAFRKAREKSSYTLFPKTI